MLDGRTMPRANRGATISVACLLLLALLLLLPPLWQPGSTVGSNCGCGWPGCGCLEMTLEPYNAPAPNFTPWAGVDVVPPGNPPAAQPTVTQAAPPATPAPAPTVGRMGRVDRIRDRGCVHAAAVVHVDVALLNIQEGFAVIAVSCNAELQIFHAVFGIDPLEVFGVVRALAQVVHVLGPPLLCASRGGADIDAPSRLAGDVVNEAGHGSVLVVVWVLRHGLESAVGAACDGLEQ